MRSFKQLTSKEKAEYIAIVLLYPLLWLFQRLGKVFRFFESRKRQLIASAASFAMIVSSVPVSFSAFAASGHTHCLCGKTHRTVGNHVSEQLTEFVEWTDPDSLPQDGGKYYLKYNYVLTQPWFPSKEKETIICLNGKKITPSFDSSWGDRVIAVLDNKSYGRGAKLTITDCTGNGSVSSYDRTMSGIEVSGPYASCNIYGGNFSNNTLDGIEVDGSVVNIYGGNFKNNGRYGIAVFRGIWSTTELNMYDGTVSYNGKSNNDGSGVLNRSVFTMYGGSINNNVAQYDGGGVHNIGGTFNMRGGTIRNNESYGKAFDNQCGGGINNYEGTVNIYDGTIRDNYGAKKGGGIYNTGTVNIYGGKIISNRALENGGGIFNGYKATLNIENSTIEENTSQEIGGGIYSALGSTITMTGGTVTKNQSTKDGGGIYLDYVKMKLGGNVTVSGNLQGTEADNVFLRKSACLQITGALTGGNIGVDATDHKPENNIAATGSGYSITDDDAAKIVSDTEGYETVRSGKNVLLRKIRENLSAANFVFTAPENLIYDGNKKTATVAADGITSGKITVKYYQNGTPLSGAPTEAGKYTVKIDVAESEVYNEVQNLTADDWTFEIAPKQLQDGDFTVTGIEDSYLYTGAAQKPVPVVTCGEKTLVAGTDYTVSYEKNIQESGSVKITFKGNYKGEKTYTFSIVYGTADESMYTLPAANEYGWYKENIIVTAKDGYKIGLTDNDFADHIEITDESANGAAQIYLKSDGTGCVYKGTVSYKLDKTAPDNIEVKYNESTFKKLLNKITFGLFFKRSVSVEAKAEDALSGVHRVWYYAADEAITNAAEITDWQESLTLMPNCKKIIYIKAEDYAGNQTVQNDQGIVLYSDSVAVAKSSEFDLNVEKQKDITVDLTLNGNSLKEIKIGTKVLSAGTDYTVSGETVVLSKNCFTAYKDGEAATVTFEFCPMGVAGDEVSQAVITINVIDTTDYHKSAVRTDELAAKCLENGHSAYWYCAVCGQYFADDNGYIDTTKAYADTQKFVLPALGHDFTKEMINADHLINAATCLDSAVYCYNCIRCDQKDKTKTFSHGNPLGHDFTREMIDGSHLIKAATCTEKAVYCYNCTRCDQKDETKTFAYGNPLGHSFTEKMIDDDHLIRAATCLESAVYCYDCVRCDQKDETKTFSHGAPLGHKYSKYIYNNDATYFADGTETADCDHTGCTIQDTRTCAGSKLIDAILPTAEIRLDENKWNTLLHNVTFGLFFNKTKDVTIEYSDAQSGVQDRYYYIADGEIDNFESIQWKAYTGEFSIDPNGKYVIYAKVTDKVGNVSVSNSEGIVVYTESAATAEKDEFDLSNAAQTGITIRLDLNGNTLREVKSSTQTLVPDTDYTVNGATITIRRDYLVKYKVGDKVTITAVMDPLGVRGNTVSKADVTITIADHHKSAQKTAALAQACTENGHRAYWHCDICDRYFADHDGIDVSTAYADTDSFVIEKIAHKNAQKTDAVEPLCLKGGNKAYWYCPDCEKYFADQNGLQADTAYADHGSFMLDPLGHKYSKYTYNNDATYFADGTETADCDHTGCTVRYTRTCIGSKLIDEVVPTAEIRLGENKWNTLLHDITFGLFFNKTQSVTIDYNDAQSGVQDRFYYIAEGEIDNFENIQWKAYTGEFSIDPNGKYVIYAKVTDKVGNFSIVSSEGLVLDNVAPQVSVSDGDIYCQEVTVSVIEEYLDSITLNGEPIQPEDGKFTLTAADAPQVIALYDKAGNKTELSVTVNAEHTFDESKITTPATVTEEGVKTYYCKYCDATRTEPVNKLAPEIVEGMNGSFTQGDGSALTFRSNAALADFLSVSVDGVVIDAKNYTLYEGSTIVKLSADYLNTLKPGKHTLAINSASGTATTEFTIQAKPLQNAQNTRSPKTGNESSGLPLAGISLLGSMLLAAALIFTKKKRAR